MTAKLYTARNYLSTAFHYAATGGIVAASFTLAPAWAIVAGGLLAGGVTVFSLKLNKSLLENYMLRHPDVHEHSQTLGKMTKELYEASGLKSEDYPVYDFRVDRKKIKEDGSINKEVLAEIFNKATMVPNAAALNLGKPVIMISEPLLKLLDEDEEKAVLAHEFAHAAARHQHLKLPRTVFASTAAIANGLTVLAAALATGVGGILSAIGGVVVGRLSFTLIGKKSDRELLFKKKKDLTLSEMHRRNKYISRKNTAGRLVALGVLSFLSPAYLKIWLAAKSLNISSMVMGRIFNRSIEYQADRGAVALGANPLALAKSLRKINVVYQKSYKAAFGEDEVPKSGTLTKIWKQATSTHPTTERRVKRLAKMARKQGYGEEEIKQAVNDPVNVSDDNIIPYETIRQIALRM